MRTINTLAFIIGTTLALNTSTFAVDAGTTTKAGQPEKDGQGKQLSIPDMIQHRIDKMNEHFKDWSAKHETKHSEHMTKMKDRLAKSKLTQAEQAEAITFAETQYKENVAYRTTQYNENIKFLESLKSQTNLTREQLKSLVQDHFTKQKDENKKHREEQTAERKAERQKLQEERKNDADPTAPTIKA